MIDPMEMKIHKALLEAGVDFVCADLEPEALDFKISGTPPVFIEVKQFHSNRISDQMSRAENVIAIQGMGAANFFASITALKAENERLTKELADVKAIAEDAKKMCKAGHPVSAFNLAQLILTAALVQKEG